MDSGKRACAMARTACAALSQSPKNTAWKSSFSGIGRIRSLASVRMPMRPSEPMIHSRRLGPAEEAGRVGISNSPVGAVSLPPANSCSMRP